MTKRNKIDNTVRFDFIQNRKIASLTFDFYGNIRLAFECVLSVLSTFPDPSSIEVYQYVKGDLSRKWNFHEILVNVKENRVLPF